MSNLNFFTWLIIIFAVSVALYVVYLLRSNSYSSSYVNVALRRRSKKMNFLSVLFVIFLDRALCSFLIYRVNRRINSAGLGRLITNIGYILTGVEIYYNAKIGYRVQMWHGQGTVIGQNVVIGDDCLILHQVTLGSGFVEIGHRVKIGAGAKVLGSIKIGDDSVIGANAVVTKSIGFQKLVKASSAVVNIDPEREITFGTRL